MNPLDDSLSMESPLETYLERHQGFKVFTHSAGTRVLVLLVFLAYLVLFGFFVRFIKVKIEGMDDLPEAFALMSNSAASDWVFYALSGVGLFLAITLLLFFIWNVVDIWGIQVCLSPVELRIENTISGPYFRKWTGIGRIRMEDIVELRGSRSATYVVGKSKQLRFSPVEKVDQLIAEILTYTKNVKIK